MPPSPLLSLEFCYFFLIFFFFFFIDSFIFLIPDVQKERKSEIARVIIIEREREGTDWTIKKMEKYREKKMRET